MKARFKSENRGRERRELSPVQRMMRKAELQKRTGCHTKARKTLYRALDLRKLDD